MLITMHICLGNFRLTYFGSGGYEEAAKTIFGRLKVDGLFLEPTMRLRIDGRR